MIKKFKIFENKLQDNNVYLKDYKLDINILYDIKELKKSTVYFELMYFKENNDIFFKIIIDATFGVFDDIIITQLGFKYVPEYSRSWDWNWKEISEEELEMLIQTNKYNL